MTFYKKISIWENRRRVEILRKFRKLVIEYFANVEYVDFGLDISEGPEAETIRPNINLMVRKVHSVISSAGINPIIYYSPPPAVGGWAGNVDLILNIFKLQEFRINSQEVVDIIDRTLGVYEDDKTRCLIRTINPLFWIGLLLDFLAGLPFWVLGEAGFNRSKMESTLAGRTFKIFEKIVMVIAAILAILRELGYLESVKSVMRNLRG